MTRVLGENPARWSSRTIAAAGFGLFLVVSGGCQETGDGELVNDVPTLSALVVMRPADGRDVDGSERIASDTVAGYLPGPESVRQVQAYFEARGFEVFEPVALAFSIVGPQPLFEQTFGQMLQVDLNDGVGLSVATEGGELEMSLDQLPDAISRVVQTVAFEPPPDFGPGSY